MYPEPKEPYPMRTLEQHLRDMEEAERTGKRVNGIVSHTPLADLPGFNFVRAFLPEYLHSCCQGVFKQFIVLWTLPKYKKEPWSIVQKISIVNNRLQRIRPSKEVTRTIDALDDLADWKASMFRSFTLFFYVILEDILPEEYFEHFCNLSYGMFILLQVGYCIYNS